jgi:regulator of nonsense transcripts 2
VQLSEDHFDMSGDGKSEEDEEGKETPHFKLLALIEDELPECNRRDKVDALAEKFCTTHGAVNKSRKRLEKAIFLVPRSRLDLIPYYSRLSAILDRVFPDTISTLVTELEQQFHGLAKWKKHSSLESRVRNAKFIGELTKFRVAPPIVALRCFFRCLDDFSGHNIDIACCLLESCGRFLFKTKHTSAKISKIMETMDRIRKAKHFDERTTELIKSSFYMVKPPQIKAQKKAKILSPIEAYIKDLLLVRLDMKNINFVLNQILCLPWNDDVSDYGVLVVKYMLKTCRKGRYKSINAIALLAGKLKKHKSELVARLIDAVFEELQFILENPNIRDQQRAITYAKLLGELHIQMLVPVQAVIDELYHFINFDHDIPKNLYNVSSEQSAAPSISSSLLKKSSLDITQPILENEEMELEDESDGVDESKSDAIEEQVAPIGVSSHSIYDPRVPSSLDPPSAVFRIKLICTLLDCSASSLVSVATVSLVNNFLSAFQRYVFIKQTLPTDIEFSLLDTFDILESRFRALKKGSAKSSSIIRYDCWLDAHNAVITVEKATSRINERTDHRLLAQAGINSIPPDGDEGVIDEYVPLDDDDDDDDDDESFDNSVDTAEEDYISIE